MPYFLKLSERHYNNSLNPDWVRKFIDIIGEVSTKCKWVSFYLVQNKKHSVRTDLKKMSMFIKTTSLDDPIERHGSSPIHTFEHQTQSAVPQMFIKLIKKINVDNFSYLFDIDEDDDLMKKIPKSLYKILNTKSTNDNGYIHITCAKYNASIMKHGLWSEETLDKNPERRTIDNSDELEPPSDSDSKYIHKLNEIKDLFDSDSTGGTLKRKQKNKNKSRVKKSKSNRRTRRRYN